MSQKSSSDVTQNEEETSLLKQLLEQNKTTSSTQQQPSSSTSDNTATSTPTFSFPPALLAANPSLANAAPGSIVVVASPRSIPHADGQPSGSSSLNQQLLHVFMVSDDENTPNSQNKEVNNKVLINRGEKEKNSTSTIKPTRLTSESER